MINNKARYNQIDAKYQQMAFRSVPTTHIWNPWSNKTDANLEDSACTVRMLLFFPFGWALSEPSYRFVFGQKYSIYLKFTLLYFPWVLYTQHQAQQATSLSRCVWHGVVHNGVKVFLKLNFDFHNLYFTIV